MRRVIDPAGIGIRSRNHGEQLGVVPAIHRQLRQLGCFQRASQRVGGSFNQRHLSVHFDLLFHLAWRQGDIDSFRIAHSDMNSGQGLSLEPLPADRHRIVAEREFGEAIVAVSAANRVAGQTSAHICRAYPGICDRSARAVGHGPHNASAKRLRR